MATASDIIWQVARIVKEQIEGTQDYLGTDLITGQPLIGTGE
jgi:hypothetical protein